MSLWWNSMQQLLALWRWFDAAGLYRPSEAIEELQMCGGSQGGVSHFWHPHPHQVYERPSMTGVEVKRIYATWGDSWCWIMSCWTVGVWIKISKPWDQILLQNARLSQQQLQEELDVSCSDAGCVQTGLPSIFVLLLRTSINTISIETGGWWTIDIFMFPTMKHLDKLFRFSHLCKDPFAS